MSPRKAGKIDSHPRARRHVEERLEESESPPAETPPVQTESVMTPSWQVQRLRQGRLDNLADGTLFAIESQLYRRLSSSAGGILVASIILADKGKMVTGTEYTMGPNTIIEPVNLV